MNLEESKEFVLADESSRMEFKLSTGQRSEAAKTVCGLLNRGGGLVLFGVDDKGAIVGQHISAKTLEDISNEMRRIEPPVFPKIEFIEWCQGNRNPNPSWTEQAGSLVLRFRPNAAAALTSQQEPRPKSRLESQLESLPESVLSLLSSGPLSKSEIAARLGQRQPSGQLHKVIRSLLDEGAIACTIPGRPQSRLQKYALVRRGGGDVGGEMAE